MDPLNRSAHEMQDQGYEDQVARCCGEYHWRCECEPKEIGPELDFESYMRCIERQACVSTETRETARDRIATAAEGVVITMQELVSGVR